MNENANKIMKFIFAVLALLVISFAVGLGVAYIKKERLAKKASVEMNDPEAGNVSAGNSGGSNVEQKNDPVMQSLSVSAQNNNTDNSSQNTALSSQVANSLSIPASSAPVANNSNETAPLSSETQKTVNQESVMNSLSVQVKQ